ncbi:family 10 glycosylhydrolase [bacterium]|nr:family 10 glycosylhydrolase [bacterium]
MTLVAAIAAGSVACSSPTAPIIPGAEVPRTPAALKEIRGVWITNVDSDVLTSRAKIAEAMEALSKAGINVVYPVVWNKAQTLYPSKVAASVTGIKMDPSPAYEGRDPLQEVIIEAHARGMEVVPWFEFGFATSYNAQGGPIIKARPNWAAIDQEGKLVNKNGFDWANALDPEVQEFMAQLVLEVAEKYDIDGIQGDDRMPAMPTLGGYDPKTVAKYRAEFGVDPPKDIKDKAWVQWRADILTEWLASLRRRVKAIDSDIVISMSPSYYSWSLTEYLQDSYTWTNRGLVDSIHPQAYRYDLPAYEKIVDDLVKNQFTREQLPMLAPGILVKSGKYIVPEDYLLGAVKYNREKGVNGEVFFFYTGLRENDSKLLGLLKAGPYAQPASLPYRSELWRPGMIQLTPLPGDGQTTTFGVLAPAAGTYDLYGKGVAGTKQPVTFQLAGAAPTSTVTLEPTDKAFAEWTLISTESFSLGQEVMVQATGSAAVMMLLNRKLSQDTQWQ